MKKLLTLSVLALASLTALAESSAPPELPHCDKPIASVMVGKVSCKTANCQAGKTDAGAGAGIAAMMAMAQAQNGGGMPVNLTGIGDGIKDMLTTALSSTGCFDIQDRDQMDEVAEELKRAGKSVQVQQADFLISGAVTQVELSSDTKSVGGGVLGLITRAPLVGGVIGSAGFKTQKAAIAVDMKLVDVNTAKVVASKRADASSETSSFTMGGGAGVLGMGGMGALGGFGGSMSSFKGTNLEAVTRDALAQSVIFLVSEAKKAKGLQ